jgi:hypothetical protein
MLASALRRTTTALPVLRDVLSHAGLRGGVETADELQSVAKEALSAYDSKHPAAPPPASEPWALGVLQHYVDTYTSDPQHRLAQAVLALRELLQADLDYTYVKDIWNAKYPNLTTNDELLRYHTDKVDHDLKVSLYLAHQKRQKAIYRVLTGEVQKS